ncbi:BRCA1-A complex subunit Abraxas 1 isoform X2 [Megalops cyprinoides]|uniref:BRCA1-A complex subunit Abraxas 1 isoform X2 n=1 Tax=Megalops cyprinoides TaxID=118141 RepID=UPI001863CCEB|nr:BRCA1-A complex subunit Abraxas 1 isoform X2 [Megalops cyprinoides]
MAELNTSVCISGFVLGSLMFQHFNSDSDAEGFILGECKAEERSNITDSQIDNIQFEHIINIQKHISCHRLGSFYSNAGEVKHDEMRRILSSYKEENVIGWYRQRRNTEQRMTFREQVVHRNLKKALSNHELVFLLLTPTVATSSGSTHRLEYSIYRSHGSQYHNIPILVNNLGMLEQQDYWRSSAPCSSLSYSRAVKKHRSRFFSSDGSLMEVNEVNDMNNTLQAELKAACVEVEESERSVEKLLAEVLALRKAVAEKKGQQEQHEKDQHSISDQPQENMMLCEAMKVLFPESPLLQTRALTFQGVPVPELCCNTDHKIDISSSLPLILTHWNSQARKWGMGRQVRTWGKRRFTDAFQTTKKKKRSTSDTDIEGSLTVSESKSEEELFVSENGNLEMSNSPVF